MSRVRTPEEEQRLRDFQGVSPLVDQPLAYKQYEDDSVYALYAERIKEGSQLGASETWRFKDEQSIAALWQ
eukprot:gene24302-10016_t